MAMEKIAHASALFCKVVVLRFHRPFSNMRKVFPLK